MFMTACCVVLACWIAILILTLPSRYTSSYWQVAWVGLDIAELAGFAATAWAAWHQRQVVIFFMIITGTLLVCDAWFDLALDYGSRGFTTSLVSALVVELPLAFLLFNSARRLVRVTITTMMRLDGTAGHVPPLWRIPLFADGLEECLPARFRPGSAEAEARADVTAAGGPSSLGVRRSRGENRGHEPLHRVPPADVLDRLPDDREYQRRGGYCPGGLPPADPGAPRRREHQLAQGLPGHRHHPAGHQPPAVRAGAAGILCRGAGGRVSAAGAARLTLSAMATDFTEETAADAVVDSFAKTQDPRLRELLSSLVRHLHAFVIQTEPTITEWERAIEFLTATGQKCDDERQEFILLSDVLGISMLVETINNRKTGGATESTVLGPFHMIESPRRELGESIDFVGTGTPCVVRGRVLSSDSTPLPGAELDVWQASDQGFYDVQQPDVQPRTNGRGLFTADPDGAFWFRTIVPSHYPIPTDGPVGTLLNATGRHAYRPAHIHFIVTAPGHRALTTHIFVAGSPYIESDAVFAVKKSLIKEFTPVDDPEQAARYGLTGSFCLASFDIILQSAAEN